MQFRLSFLFFVFILHRLFHPPLHFFLPSFTSLLSGHLFSLTSPPFSSIYFNAVRPLHCLPFCILFFIFHFISSCRLLLSLFFFQDIFLSLTSPHFFFYLLWCTLTFPFFFCHSASSFLILHFISFLLLLITFFFRSFSYL